MRHDPTKPPTRRQIRYAQTRDAELAQMALWRAANKEQKREMDRIYREANGDAIRAHKRQVRINDPESDAAMQRRNYLRHIEQRKAAARAYHHANKELLNPKRRERSRKNTADWKRANYGRVLANNAMRSKRTRLHMPDWVNREAIVQVYMACPDGYDVDHIVPIAGITVEGYRVNGLHVPWNLQYLPASQNAAKKNRMRPEDAPLRPERL